VFLEQNMQKQSEVREILQQFNRLMYVGFKAVIDETIDMNRTSRTLLTQYYQNPAAHISEPTQYFI